MAILITGGAGYIGSHMVYELADRGELPVVIDDFSSGFEWAIPSGVSVFVGDIGDQRRVAALIAKYGISEIIHFAASVVVPESVAEPLRYYRNNTRRRSCSAHWTGNARATHLIKVAAETAVGLREKMQVFGTDYPTPDGTCIRDYVHVSDLVNAHYHALSYLRGGGESLTLNCGYGRGFSVLQVIEAMRHESGNDFPVELAARRSGDPAEIVASAERMRNARLAASMG